MFEQEEYLARLKEMERVNYINWALKTLSTVDPFVGPEQIAALAPTLDIYYTLCQTMSIEPVDPTTYLTIRQEIDQEEAHYLITVLEKVTDDL